MRMGFIGTLLGVATGAGGDFRVHDAMEQLRQYVEAGDRTVHIVGLSRGAVLVS